MVEAGVFALGRAQPSSWVAAATTKPLRSSWQPGRPVVPRVAHARDALTESDRLAVVVQLEHQVAVLSRKLGFDQP